jgi:hypothetical protein
MPFQTGSLSNYTDQNNFPLIHKSVFGGKTAQILSKMAGIKSAETLNILDSDARWQLGGTCGFLSSGSTAYTQRTLTVGKIKVQESLCPKSLEQFYLQIEMNAGSSNQRLDTRPWEQVYSEMKALQNAKNVERALWQGDTNDSSDVYKRFDGLLKLIDAEPTVVRACASNATAITSSNILAIMDELYGNIPIEVLDKDDFMIGMGWDVFRFYTVALKNQNLFNYNVATAGAANDGELVMPGTNIKVVALNGLNLNQHNATQSSSVQRLIGFRTSTTFLGTDLMNEQDKFEIFFAKEADEFRYTLEFKLGTQIAFPAEVIEYGVA